MFKVRKTKKKSSASCVRPSSAAHSTEEPDDLRSDEGHGSDSRISVGEGHVSTLANYAEQDLDSKPQLYTPPPRPRLYAAAAPRPVSTREHHLQLAGHLYEMEMERVLNGQQEKLSELAAKYYSHLLESAPSPVSVASLKTSSADDTNSEVSSPPSLNSTVSHTTHSVQESSSVVQMSSDSVCQSSEGTSSSTFVGDRDQEVVQITSNGWRAGSRRSLVVRGLSVILTLQSKFLKRVRSYVDL